MDRGKERGMDIYGRESKRTREQMSNVGDIYKLEMKQINFIRTVSIHGNT